MQLFAVDKIKYEMLGTSVSQYSLVIGTTPGQIIPKDTDYKLMVIRNIGNSTVYLGNSSVTYSNGFPLYKKEAIGLVDYKGDLYGVTEAASTELRIMIFR